MKRMGQKIGIILTIYVHVHVYIVACQAHPALHTKFFLLQTKQKFIFMFNFEQ